MLVFALSFIIISIIGRKNIVFWDWGKLHDFRTSLSPFARFLVCEKDEKGSIMRIFVVIENKVIILVKIMIRKMIFFFDALSTLNLTFALTYDFVFFFKFYKAFSIILELLL